MRPSRLVAAFVALTALALGPSATADTFDAAHLPEVTDAELAAATLPLDAEEATLSLVLNEQTMETIAKDGTGTVATLSSDILFDFDSTTPRKAAAGKVSDLVKGLPTNATVSVTGYTDSIGDAAYNLTLSTRRAEAVAALLRAARPDLRLTVAGKGEADPVADNGTREHDNPAGRAKNRRVELRYST